MKLRITIDSNLTYISHLLKELIGKSYLCLFKPSVFLYFMLQGKQANYNISLLILLIQFIILSTINVSASPKFERDDFFKKNNFSYVQWLNETKKYEADKSASNFYQAIVIYQHLINTTEGDENLIARLRLARLIIQYKDLPNRYTSALKQLAIVEQSLKPSYLLFTYYMHAIIYAHGYDVPVDKKKALDYQQKYQQLLNTKIKISALLQDITLVSAQRLKQMINSSQKTIVNWRNKQNSPLFWKNKPFCKRNQYNHHCHNPAWSVSDCQKVFYNDRIDTNHCKSLVCNNSTTYCYDIINVEPGEKIPLHKRPYKNSNITGYLGHNAHFILANNQQYQKNQSSKINKPNSWIEVQWCESGPVLFLHECSTNSQAGFINTYFLKHITDKTPVTWVKNN